MRLGTWWMAMLAICGAINVAMANETETGQVVRLPEVKVTEQVLREEQPVGPYQQPKWTSGGQIDGEAVYVLPAWNAELSQRWFPERDRDGEFDNQFNHEIEVGLPHRFQADFNENWGVDHLGHVEHRGAELEGRAAAQGCQAEAEPFHVGFLERPERVEALLALHCGLHSKSGNLGLRKCVSGDAVDITAWLDPLNVDADAEARDGTKNDAAGMGDAQREAARDIRSAFGPPFDRDALRLDSQRE